MKENVIVIGQSNHDAMKREQPENKKLFARLSQALIEHCRQDGNDASRLLSVKLSNINSELSALKEKINNCATAEELEVHVQSAVSDVMETFLELQFFDRVSQRLEHAMSAVDYSLEPEKAVSEPIEHQFTMEDERVLFDALRDGADVNEAVEQATTLLDQTLDKTDGDDIELF